VGVFHVSQPLPDSAELLQTPVTKTEAHLSVLNLESPRHRNPESAMLPRAIPQGAWAPIDGMNKKRKFDISDENHDVLIGRARDVNEIPPWQRPNIGHTTSNTETHLRRDSAVQSHPNSQVVFHRPNFSNSSSHATSRSIDSMPRLAPKDAMGPPEPPRRLSITNTSGAEHVYSGQASRTSSLGLLSNVPGVSRANVLPSSQQGYQSGPGGSQSRPHHLQEIRIPPISAGPPPSEIADPSEPYFRSGELNLNMNGAALRRSGLCSEAVITKMPFEGKIKILRQVVPPIGRIESDRLALMGVQGTFIAIEGDDEVSLSQVAYELQLALEKTGEFNVRVVDGPQGPKLDTLGPKEDKYARFLQEILRWHAKVCDIYDFVSGVRTDFSSDGASLRTLEQIKSPSRVETSTQASPGSRTSHASRNSDEMDIDNKPQSSRRRIPAGVVLRGQKGCHSPSAYEYLAEETRNEDISSESGKSTTPRIPVLLIPGYLLRASNIWAAELPLNDSYGVRDHWSWVATMWRSVPGADLTVYVRNENSNGYHRGSVGGQRRTLPGEQQIPPTPQTAHSLEIPWSSRSNVEMLEATQTFVIRKESESLVDKATMRRAAFEIGEWVRLAAARKS
jgi:hypothetical protein